MAHRARTGRMVAAVLAALVLAALTVGAVRAVAASGSVDERTAAIEPAPSAPLRLRRPAVERIARGSEEIRAWWRDHPVKDVQVHPDRENRTWTVDFLGPDRTVHSQVVVDDATGTIREVRTGAQVAWQMARGYKGAFGRSLTEPQIWIPLFVAFLLPLIRWRRPVSWHTLDLLMLCAFGVSLVWFNRGEIGTSVPLVYPPLAYLFVRLLVVGFAAGRGRSDPEQSAPRARVPRIESVMPTWLLVSLLCLLMGLRLGLNAFDSNVIDVGYAGVIGADRIQHAETPYGTFPGDCSECDTYGPLTYLTYVPFERFMPWTGSWNDLPAAHGAAVAFDLMALAGLLVLGWRLGGRRLAAGLGLAWAAYPFTAYALESNSNDSLVAALLVWGLVVAHRPMGRAAAVALAAWAKFVPVILIPLWSRSPFPRAPDRRWRYVLGLAIATAVSAWPILLDGFDGVRRFWSRTLGYQLDRESPFSVWGMHPSLRPLQLAIQLLVIGLAIVLVARPRRLDLRGFAALSGALLVGVQLTMPHWFYLYIPWFAPLAFVALVPHWSVPADRRSERPVDPPAVEVPVPGPAPPTTAPA